MQYEYDEERAKVFSLMLECPKCGPRERCGLWKFRDHSVEDKMRHAFRMPEDEIKRIIKDHRQCRPRQDPSVEEDLKID